MGFYGAMQQAEGAKYEGEAKANMYNYQAGVAEINKHIQLQNADWARNAGEVEASISGMKSRQQMGEIAAAQSGSGVDVNSGTAVRVRDSQHDVAAYDQSLIRNKAAKAAYGYEVEAFQQGEQAKIYRMGADYSRKSGEIKAKTSIIGGAASLLNQGSQFLNTFGNPLAAMMA